MFSQEPCAAAQVAVERGSPTCMHLNHSLNCTKRRPSIHCRPTTDGAPEQPPDARALRSQPRAPLPPPPARPLASPKLPAVALPHASGGGGGERTIVCRRGSPGSPGSTSSTPADVDRELPGAVRRFVREFLDEKLPGALNITVKVSDVSGEGRAGQASLTAACLPWQQQGSAAAAAAAAAAASSGLELLSLSPLSLPTRTPPHPTHPRSLACRAPPPTTPLPCWRTPCWHAAGPWRWLPMTPTSCSSSTPPAPCKSLRCSPGRGAACPAALPTAPHSCAVWR